MESSGVCRETKLKTRNPKKERKRCKASTKKPDSHSESELEAKQSRSTDSGDEGEKKKLRFEPAPSSSQPRETKDSGGHMSWCLCNSFEIRPPISLPFLTRCALDDQILIRDLWSDELYLTSVKDGTTKEVFINQLKGDVFHCARLGNDKMVYCDSKSGLVHVCTTAGQHVKTISITHRPATHMYSLTVDRKGLILFGVRDGKIFTIDPEDGTILSSSSVNTKIESVIATSSGHIVIRSGIAKFNVILDGVIVHTITDPEWCWAACVAHPSEDVIYISYSKETDGTNRRISTMRPTGETLKDEVFELGEAPHRFLRPSIAITESCKIIMCDNGKLMVYEQKNVPGKST